MFKKTILYNWLTVSVIFIGYSIYAKESGLFLFIITASCITFPIVTYYKTKNLRLLPSTLLPPCLFAMLSSLSLYDNYVSARMGEQDGIGISNQLAYLYLGEDHWSLERFRQAFEASMLVTVAVIAVYLLSVWITIVLTQEHRADAFKAKNKAASLR